VLVAPLEISVVPRLLQDGAKQDTPGNLTAININAYRSYLSAHKIINAILRVNQYSARSTTAGALSTEADSRIWIRSSSLHVQQTAASGNFRA